MSDEEIEVTIGGEDVDTGADSSSDRVPPSSVLTTVAPSVSSGVPHFRPPPGVVISGPTPVLGLTSVPGPTAPPKSKSAPVLSPALPPLPPPPLERIEASDSGAKASAKARLVPRGSVSAAFYKFANWTEWLGLAEREWRGSIGFPAVMFEHIATDPILSIRN